MSAFTAFVNAKFYKKEVQNARPSLGAGKARLSF